MQETLTFSQRDEFERKAIAEKIIKLLVPETDISPLVIDGDWGTGKTEFSIKLKNLISELEPDSKVVYVDAFKGDHAESPLLLITSAIASILPKADKKAFIQKAVPALRFVTKTALKAGANWVLRQEAENVAEELQEAMKEASNVAIENMLQDHMEAEKNINSLKECISNLSEKNKVTIIIDELDRCKPSFSTSILETIKHIFDIDNVYFILVANTKQLKASINHIYGYSINSQKYLDKFIKYTITLPDSFLRNGYEMCRASSVYWAHLVKSSPTLSLVHKSAGYHVNSLIERANLTLRETNTFARNLTIFQKINDEGFTENTHEIYKVIFVVSVFIHCFGDKELLKEEFTSDSIDKLANLLRVNSIISEMGNGSKIPWIAIIFYGLIKQDINLSAKFSFKNEDDYHRVDDLFVKLSGNHLWNTNIKEQIIFFVEQMSFIR